MAGFTNAEVQASIDRFLLTQVKVDRLRTGSRDVVGLRNAVYDLLATTLLLRPDAYFYVVYLAKNRLRSLLDQQLEDLDTISVAGPNTTRPEKKITSTAELVNAKAATLELNAGLNARSTGVSGSIGPAVDRFRRSVSRFVGSELTKNVVEAGVVVETGPELRNTVSEAWARAVERHGEIQDLSANIVGAIGALGRTKLPESAVRSLVSKIQDRLDELQVILEATTGVRDSREAMLDLLTMRTLLTRASSFRDPETRLMPKTGDTSLGVFLDSPGVEASIVGSVSAPYNYDPSTSLGLSLNTASSLPVVALPGSSRAEVRSKPLSFPSGPTAPAEAAFYLDFTSTVSGDPHAGGAPLAPWASGTDAATKLGSLLPGISVVWDAAAGQLVFQSEDEGDISLLRALSDSVARVHFVDWAFGGSAEGRYRPRDTKPILDAISSAAALAAAESEETTYATFSGTRTGLIGEEAMLWDFRDQGVDLLASGTSTVSSPTRNFAAMGIRAGMRVVVTAPYAAAFTVLGVSGNTLDLDASAAPGALTYYVGPDYSVVPPGARVQATGTGVADNTGFYRVVSGGDAVLTLDRDLIGEDSAVRAVVYTRYLEVSSTGTTTASGIAALPGAGSIALGLPTVAEDRAQLSVFELSGSGDFVVRGVRPGDLLDLTAPSLATYTAEISAVEPSRLTLVDPVLYEPGAWSYVVRSARSSQFDILAGGVANYLESQYATGFPTIDRLIGRLIRGARYAGEIQAAVEAYTADITALNASLSSYVVPREVTVDSAVNTMREQGFDRALDLFLSLEIEELFSMDPDGVSYTTWLVRKSAIAAREVVPVSKHTAGTDSGSNIRVVSSQPDPYDPLSRDDKAR